MIFDDKIHGRSSLSDSENSKRIEKPNHLEPFSFSALHFLRNRLLPTGKEIFSKCKSKDSAITDHSLKII